jgi:signal transduction histidine kinase
MERASHITDWTTVNESYDVFVRRARAIGQVLSWASFLVTLTVPVGWLLGVPILRPVNPTVTPTHVINSALGISLSLSIVLLYRGMPARWGWIAWTAIIVVASEVLVEYLTPGELPFAQSIRFLDPFSNVEKIPPNAAMCIWFLSLAALLLTLGRPLALRIGQGCCVAAGFIAALAIIGHAYTVEPFYILASPYPREAPYNMGNYSGMTVPGAVTYLLIAVSLLLLRSDRGMMRILTTRSSAGVMSRRLYTAVVFIPPILGFVALVSAEVWKWYDVPFAISLLALVIVLLFAAVVAVTSLKLEQVDISRVRAEQGLRASREQLRELSGHIQDMQEEERVRIAREVHDELGQSLTALKMDVAMLRNQLPMTDELERRTSSMIRLVNSTIRSVQRISSELRPSLLDDLGLEAAIEWQAREFEQRSGVACTLDLNASRLTIDAARSTALFRIFQETLTNIARHANAKHVDIRLSEEDGSVHLRVRDDGIGIESETNSESLGIMGMRERALLAGGTLSIESEPESGTIVSVVMPVEENLSPSIR